MIYEHDLNISELLHVHLFEQMKVSPQKISIELEDQSLTYAEVSYSVQQIALTLLKSADYSPSQNKIVYQLVERSIEMPLGMFAIFTAGGIYMALHPQEPDVRLSSLIVDTISQDSAKVSNTVYYQLISATKLWM